jgi:hypothetical protein
MAIRPSLMSGPDLDGTATAVAHILSCDQRYGDLGPANCRWLEALLRDVRAEQDSRRSAAASAEASGPSRG